MNVVSNVWTSKAKGRSRVVTVRIETTRPAGTHEFELMARLTEVVDAYIGEEGES